MGGTQRSSRSIYGLTVSWVTLTLSGNDILTIQVAFFNGLKNLKDLGMAISYIVLPGELSSRSCLPRAPVVLLLPDTHCAPFFKKIIIIPTNKLSCSWDAQAAERAARASECRGRFTFTSPSIFPARRLFLACTCVGIAT